MNVIRSVFVLVLLVSLISGGCSKSDTPEQVQIPVYPGAKADEEHNAKVMGISLGMVKRVVTSDSYDNVLAFYKEQLESYNPEIITHTLEDGRQTAITVVENEAGSKTVAIQEFKKEGMVAITYMRVGF